MVINKDYSQDTIELLSEINSGCKMAIDSMKQVEKYVDDKKLMDIIQKYKEEHIRFEEQSQRLLHEAGHEGKEPGVMAKTFSTLQANVKMLMKDDVHQAAGILTDGCNMGIKSLCEFKNQYKAADNASVDLCEKVCSSETRMLDDLQPLL